jgi:hypothetical protein
MAMFRRISHRIAGVFGDPQADRGGGPRATKKLPAYASSYLESLIEEFVILKISCQHPGRSEIVDAVEQILKKERLTWGDIFTIERAILGLQPPETIRRRAWSLRDRYRVVVGEHAYAEYLGSSPPDPAGAATTPEALRTDLDQLLSEFHWLYQITPIREGVRNRISKDILQGMTVALAILLGLMALDHHLGGRTNLSTIWMILFMGAIGAFVSLQHRIQSIPTTGDEILNILALEGGWLNVFLAPISGSVFAFVLYLTFSAGFIQGALFPKMNWGEVGPPYSAGDAAAATGTGAAGRVGAHDRDSSFVHFLWHSIPRDHFDLAKLLLWCFVAGFAERLVPGTLDRMITRKIAVVTDGLPRSSAVVPTPREYPHLPVSNAAGAAEDRSRRDDRPGASGQSPPPPAPGP